MLGVPAGVMVQVSLLDGGWCPVASVAQLLDRDHYLGAARRGIAWADEYGVLVLSSPTSRFLPHDWLELSRWCLRGVKNGGSRQWARVVPAIREKFPNCTTVVSYSDPEAGHTGALYRACNWRWAPTWHRLRCPPSGGGSWDGITQQAPKDRWVFPVRKDRRRAVVLALRDATLRNRMPWAEFKEPRGGDYKRWKDAQAQA